MTTRSIQFILRDFLVRIFLKLYPSNQKLTGKCNKCGSCCKKLYLVDEQSIISSEIKFNALLQKDNKYSIFRVVDKDVDGNLIFRCSLLGKDNLCSDYKNRPEICRNYPDKLMFKMFGNFLDGCGYSRKPIIKFKTIYNGIIKR